MPTTQTAPAFKQIRGWLNEINREKQAAATKAGKAHTEWGGYAGETTHVSKDVDDGLRDASEGARSAENEKDIKDGPFAGTVNETSDNPGKTQEDLMLNIGTKSAPTGGDHSVERSYKEKMKDPGTTSFMDGDKVGDKYGEHVRKEAGALSNLANEIFADIATSSGISTPAQKTATTHQSAPQRAPQAAQPTATAAVEAGYELASFFGLNKAAADQTVQTVVAETIKHAQVDAERTGAYLVALMNENNRLMKRAADPGAGDMGEGHADPAAGGAPPDMGGPPPDAGGPPPDAGGPPGGGGGDHAQALQELSMALMELGISPEELSQLAAQGGGAGGPPPGAGGPPPDAGGMGGPPGAPPPGGPADMGGKIASAVREYKRSGRFKVTEAKTAAQRTQRDEMKKYVLEILGSTR